MLRRRGDRDPLEQNLPRWIRFVNDGVETVPAFGALRPSRAAAEHGRRLLFLTKPDTILVPQYYLNGPRTVAYQERGWCTIAPHVEAAYNAAAGTPNINETWGPKANEFELFPGRPGFRIVGNADQISIFDGVLPVPTDRVQVVPEPITQLLGKCDNDIAEGDAGTVSIWTGTPGSETDSGFDVTARNRSSDKSQDEWVRVDYINGGWYILGKGGEGETPVRFQLDANLSPGGSAAATIVTWNGSDWVADGASITVHDYNGHHAGIAGVPYMDGDRGWCFQSSDSSRYEIMELGGTLVRGKLDTTLTAGGSATVSIWRYNGSEDVDTGVNITVHDWLHKCGVVDVAGGLMVWAAYDAGSDRWYLVKPESFLPGYAQLRGVSQSVTGSSGGGEVTINFSTAEFNRNAIASGTYDNITVTCAGMYLIHGHFGVFKQLGNRRKRLDFHPAVNGVVNTHFTAPTFLGINPDVDADYDTPGYTRMVRLAAGDVITAIALVHASTANHEWNINAGSMSVHMIDL